MLYHILVSSGLHHVLLPALLGELNHSWDDFPPLCPTAEELYLLAGDFSATSISHPQGTATNIYFKPGLLTSVEKAVWAQGGSEAKKSLKHLHLSDSPGPYSPHCCLSTPPLALQDSRAAVGVSQSPLWNFWEGQGSFHLHQALLPKAGFHQGPIKANQGLEAE